MFFTKLIRLYFPFILSIIYHKYWQNLELHFIIIFLKNPTSVWSILFYLPKYVLIEVDCGGNSGNSDSSHNTAVHLDVLWSWGSVWTRSEISKFLKANLNLKQNLTIWKSEHTICKKVKYVILICYFIIPEYFSLMKQVNPYKRLDRDFSVAWNYDFCSSWLYNLEAQKL